MALVMEPTTVTIHSGLFLAVKQLTKERAKDHQVAGRLALAPHLGQHQAQLPPRRRVAHLVLTLQIGLSTIQRLTRTRLRMSPRLQAKLTLSILVSSTSALLLALPQCHIGHRHLMVHAQIPRNSL